MSNPVPLKTLNMKYIFAVLATDVLIITAATNQLDLFSSSNIYFPLLLISGISASTASVIALAVNHLLPRKIKEIILFLRFKNVQPGCRAFSSHARKDKRIDLASLKKNAGGKLPKKASEQNTLWYKLLKKTEGKPSVQYAHKSYLLFRDLASLSAMLFILVSFPLLLYKPCQTTEFLTGWFFLQYLACMIAGRNSGNSLVGNVLAEASCL